MQPIDQNKLIPHNLAKEVLTGSFMKFMAFNPYLQDCFLLYFLFALLWKVLSYAHSLRPQTEKCLSKD